MWSIDEGPGPLIREYQNFWMKSYPLLGGFIVLIGFLIGVPVAFSAGDLTEAIAVSCLWVTVWVLSGAVIILGSVTRIDIHERGLMLHRFPGQQRFVHWREIITVKIGSRGMAMIRREGQLFPAWFVANWSPLFPNRSAELLALFELIASQAGLHKIPNLFNRPAYRR